MTPVLSVAALGLAAWIYLLFGRGFFWLARQRDDLGPVPAPPAVWPAVAAIVPARDEADVIARSIASLAAQDYPGPLRIILIDDASADGTAQVARSAGGERLRIFQGAPLPAGWTGKLWAVAQGIQAAGAAEPLPAFVLLTDADIAHAPDTLTSLVARARADGLVLTSLMARLSTATFPERMLIPAFVFFFAMLFPFAWVNDPRRRVAAAAGGCMLVNADALCAAGGIAAISGEIIDDCALARLMKPRGPIWLGLTRRAVSLRPYPSFAAITAMVSRSAYAQLRYSPWLLAGTVIGMTLIWLAPALIAIFASGAARWMGAAAWLAMATAFQPTLRFFRLSPLWGLALPVIGALYGAFTVQSALQLWRGRGGMWKGRSQAAFR
jgi:hopene-associated glycosyltransferase HpnB